MKAKITVELEDGSGCKYSANHIQIAHKGKDIIISTLGISEFITTHPKVAICGRCNGKSRLPCALCNGTGKITK